MRLLIVAAAIVAVSNLTPTRAEQSAPVEDLGRMSLEELAKVEVTSVSKSGERLSEAPAAVYLITHTDIIRSGATSIPEVLRLAPNLEITQMSASSYVVSARGFGGNPVVQNFSNKLLVLIDGRSVYTPLFSGVYYDAQAVMLEDIDRIEVISGPGATLWGANAMNGVINIITRSAAATAGGLLSAAGGNQEQDLSARYGGRINADTAYRVYALIDRYDAMELPNGSSAGDGWVRGQGGFRLDWARAADRVTVQGDAYRATENQLGTGDLLVSGANTLARWQHQLSERSDLQIQAYYDDTERAAPTGGDAFVVHTYDVELQQSLAIGEQRIVWGAGERLNSYGITNSATLLFLPSHRDLTLGNVFGQDAIALSNNVKLVLGLKLEDDPYSGWSAQPDLRLSWQLSPTALIWAAASQAIRSPTPFDADVVEKLGGEVFLTGNANFHPERVAAYEWGYRSQPAARLSLSVSAFYNDYSDLRTIEPNPSTFIPLRWDNLMRGSTYGLELWATYQVNDWWRLSPGLRTLHQDLRFDAGASGLLGLSQAGDDPTHQGSLTSSMDLGRNMSFDASLRYVSALPDPALAAYYDLTARFAWRPSSALELAVSGFNLLHARHLEFPAPYGEEIVRSGLAELRWTF